MSLTYDAEGKPQLDSESTQKVMEMAIEQLIADHPAEFQKILSGFYQAAVLYEQKQLDSTKSLHLPESHS